MSAAFGPAPPSRRLVVDRTELARYRASPDSRAAEIRFARHVLTRDAEDVWALTALAKHARDNAEFERLMRHAIGLGFQRLEARLGAGETVDFGNDVEFEPTLLAMMIYGSHEAMCGRIARAGAWLQAILDLDPQDRIGAIGIFGKYGIVADGAGPLRPT